MGYDEDKQSKFNAGVALAERIDALQRAINGARYNPLGINQETGVFNYEIIISSNNGLLNEAWSKLSADEKKVGDGLRKLVNVYILNNPPMIIKGSNSMQIHPENFKKLLELLDFYEKKNKDFLDSHSLNSPNTDMDDGL